MISDCVYFSTVGYTSVFLDGLVSFLSFFQLQVNVHQKYTRNLATTLLTAPTVQNIVVEVIMVRKEPQNKLLINQTSQLQNRNTLPLCSRNQLLK